MEREEWNHRYSGTELLWTAAPNRILVGEVEELPAGRALDIGCGEGRNAVWLAEKGWRVTGVDFSDVALDKAQRLAEVSDMTVERAERVQRRVETDTGERVAIDALVRARRS